MHGDDAKILIRKGQISLTFQESKVGTKKETNSILVSEVLTARDIRSTSVRSSSTDRSLKWQSQKRTTHWPTTTTRFSTYNSSSWKQKFV